MIMHDYSTEKRNSKKATGSPRNVPRKTRTRRYPLTQTDLKNTK